MNCADEWRRISAAAKPSRSDGGPRYGVTVTVHVMPAPQARTVIGFAVNSLRRISQRRERGWQRNRSLAVRSANGTGAGTRETEH